MNILMVRRREFAAVVMDETMAECDPAAAEAVWERAGLAIPLQINFALSGAARLTREIRAGLHRREREQAVARRAASAAIETELKTTIAGLLLHSQLALSDSEMTSPIAEKCDLSRLRRLPFRSLMRKGGRQRTSPCRSFCISCFLLPTSYSCPRLPHCR